MGIVMNISLDSWTNNENLKAWIKDKIALCNPKDVHLCTGTKEEFDTLVEKQENANTLIRLDQQLRPNSFLARSNPADIARVESRTFICSKDKADAGPTNNWHEPKAMKEKLHQLFTGCMENLYHR